MGFVTLALALLASGFNSVSFYIVAGMFIIWGTRLSWHIAARKINKPEDPRYTKFRLVWRKNFLLRSYLQLFLLQGVLITIIATPLFLATEAHGTSYTPIQYLGIFIWLFGFVFEFIADFQLNSYLGKNKTRNGPFDKGLWSWSRHPNYFGEVILWWGIWLLVMPYEYGVLAIISPVTITFLILFISGIPPQEIKHKNDPTYANYRKRTSIFIPLPPKIVKK